MKISIISLFLIALLGIIVSASIAQQNQNVPKTDTEVEKLKIQLQTVENEKMEIETKLAEAHAKLIDTEFDKLKLELKDSNEKWLLGWIGFLGVMFAVFGVALWFFVKSLIENRVEKRLNGFKESVDKVSILEGQLKVLKKEHAVSVLENFVDYRFATKHSQPEQIKALEDEILLDVFCDKTRLFPVRFNAANVLSIRESPLLVSPVLELLNSVVDSKLNLEAGIKSSHLYPLIKFVGEIHTNEAYQGLKNFINLLLTENPKNKGLLLPDTVISLTMASIKLNIGDAVPILKSAVSHLEDVTFNLIVLAEYFYSYNEYAGIKDILNFQRKYKYFHAESRCLELLEKHDPDFVRDWKAQKETTNTKSEETDESKPTT